MSGRMNGQLAQTQHPLTDTTKRRGTRMTTKTPRLILRTCRPDMTSHGGFVWPTSGKVEAPDWNPEPECGGGLHGLLNGQGNASLLDWSADAVWIVARPGRLLVDIDGDKVKCKTATVIYSGDHAGALATLRAAGVTEQLPGNVVTAGISGQATAGDYGQATAGYYGQATAGIYGTIAVRWWDGGRYRLAVGYVGEDGIEPNVAYRCDCRGQLVKVTP
jgi:hypothetical protein